GHDAQAEDGGVAEVAAAEHRHEAEDVAERPAAAHGGVHLALVDEGHRDRVADAVDGQEEQGQEDLLPQFRNDEDGLDLAHVQPLSPPFGRPGGPRPAGRGPAETTGGGGGSPPSGRPPPVAPWPPRECWIDVMASGTPPGGRGLLPPPRRISDRTLLRLFLAA